MNSLYLVGFNAKASAAVANHLLADKHRAAAWEMTTDLERANVVLINATNRGVVDECARLAAPWQDLVIVGESDFGTGWPLVTRPVTLTSIFDGIQSVMARKSQFDPIPSDWAANLEGDTSHLPLTRNTRHAPLPPAPAPAPDGPPEN